MCTPVHVSSGMGVGCMCGMYYAGVWYIHGDVCVVCMHMPGTCICGVCGMCLWFVYVVSVVYVCVEGIHMCYA